MAERGDRTMQIKRTLKTLRTAPDTVILLFLLSAETARSEVFFSIDAGLMGITAILAAMLPFAVANVKGDENAAEWLIGRGFVALAGIISGLSFNLAIGSTLPLEAKFAPFSLLIAAAVVSCCIQLVNLARLQPAD